MDWYQTAAQFYMSEHRVLEQRSIAFFLIQSLLAGGFIALLIKLPMTDPLHWPSIGIILVGIAFCALYIKSGKVVARGAYIWREYMLKNESQNTCEQGLWCFYSESCEKHKWHSQTKYLRELPSPTLWLYSPMIFITAWMCALVALFYREWSCFYIVAICIGVVTTIILHCCHVKIHTK
ncbi:hypothetical protein ES707_12567 [subsurface metagenome]